MLNISSEEFESNKYYDEISLENLLQRAKENAKTDGNEEIESSIENFIIEQLKPFLEKENFPLPTLSYGAPAGIDLTWSYDVFIALYKNGEADCYAPNLGSKTERIKFENKEYIFNLLKKSLTINKIHH